MAATDQGRAVGEFFRFAVSNIAHAVCPMKRMRKARTAEANVAKILFPKDSVATMANAAFQKNAAEDFLREPV